MGNDTIQGSVMVNVAKVNNGQNDQGKHPEIHLTGDNFGSTTLTETYGHNLEITVDSTKVKDLTAKQGDGDNSVITISNLIVSTTSFGVRTTQGNGYNDVTTIDTVRDTVSAGNAHPQTRMVSSVRPRWPASRSSRVTAAQDDKDHKKGETATVNNAILPGHIYITQGNHDAPTWPPLPIARSAGW